MRMALRGGRSVQASAGGRACSSRCGQTGWPCGAHRSHEVVDIGECLIAYPGITDLGLPALRWPVTASVEAVVGTGSGERAVIITGANPRGRPPRTPRDRGGSTSPGLPDPPGADSVLGRVGHRLTPVRGRTYLSQRAAGRDWRVSAGVFWQVHPGAADVLTEAVMTALEPRPGDVALDLYCGAGLFAGALAPAVGPGGTVVGVEADAAAVRDARHNLREWPWARVHKGDMAAVLRRSGARGAESAALPAARLVVADPPRAGLARDGHRLRQHGGARPRSGSPTCPAIRPRWPGTSACSWRAAGRLRTCAHSTPSR